MSIFQNWFKKIACFGIASLFSLVLGFSTAQAFSLFSSDTIAVANLPVEAQQTLALIKAGGPFPYAKDGSVFGNYEKLLPKQRRGYYREYTVPTPGLRNRGPQRIIAGLGTTGNTATSGEYWYTPDHYRSFKKIKE